MCDRQTEIPVLLQNAKSKTRGLTEQAGFPYSQYRIGAIRARATSSMSQRRLIDRI
jgi:hypothetical protein